MRLTFRLLLIWALTTSLANAVTVTVQLQGVTGAPLADGIVFLDSREAKQLVKPATGAEIAQTAKQFSPRVLVVPVGTAVNFPNRDTVRHHVYSFSPIKPFELKLYSGTSASPVVFDKPGIAVLGCNIHDNMSAWVVVVETPFFATGDAKGIATLRNVPSGNYRLRVWHTGLAVDAPASDQPLSVGGADMTLKLQMGSATP
jgi:plastocyanin